MHIFGDFVKELPLLKSLKQRIMENTTVDGKTKVLPAEYQMFQSQMIPIHASSAGHAHFNEDNSCVKKVPCAFVHGFFIYKDALQRLSSFLSLCIKLSSMVRSEAKEAIVTQQNAKLERINLMKEKTWISINYINKLLYHDVKISKCCWRNVKQVDDELVSLSATSILEETQILICVWVFGLDWEDHHHFLLRNGKKFPWHELAMHVNVKSILLESISQILKIPPVNLPPWKDLLALGILAPHIIELENWRNVCKKRDVLEDKRIVGLQKCKTKLHHWLVNTY